MATLLGFLLVFSSCDEDEPKVEPIVGKWILDDVEISEAPTGFSNVEGTSNSLYGEEEYSIEFFDDFEYNRELLNVPSIGGDVDDEGVWELIGDEITLEPDNEIGGLDYSFTVVEEIDDRLTITTQSSTPAFSDQFIVAFNETSDTITSQESFDAILDANTQLIQVRTTFEFDRED